MGRASLIPRAAVGKTGWDGTLLDSNLLAALEMSEPVTHHRGGRVT